MTWKIISVTSLTAISCWHIQLFGCACCFSSRQWFADLLTVSEGFHGREEGVEERSFTWCKLGCLQLQGWQAPVGCVSLLPCAGGMNCMSVGAHRGILALCKHTGFQAAIESAFSPASTHACIAPEISELPSTAPFLAAKAHAVPQLH